MFVLPFSVGIDGALHNLFVLASKTPSIFDNSNFELALGNQKKLFEEERKWCKFTFVLTQSFPIDKKPSKEQ